MLGTKQTNKIFTNKISETIQQKGTAREKRAGRCEDVRV